MKLIAIYDTKQLDTDGQKVFLGESLPICQHCGRTHTVVCELSDGKTTLKVGTTCAKKLMGANYDTQKQNAVSVTFYLNLLVSRIPEYKAQQIETIGKYWMNANATVQATVYQKAVEMGLLVKSEEGYKIA